MKELMSILGDEFSRPSAESLLKIVFAGRYAAFAHGAAEKKELCEITRLGQIACDDVGEKRVEVLLVRISGNLAIRRNRVGLRRAVDRYYNAADSVSGLLAFYYKEGESSWRLGYAYKRAVRDEGGAFKSEATDLRRCSYLLGTGENVKTPALRLEELSNVEAPVRLSDIEEAFSVEAVSERFFSEYRAFYDRFALELARPANRVLFGFAARRELDPRSPEAKSIRDFAKKLLGRIVFLKFLEKKGWLGASDYAKGDGRRDFLHDLFKTYRKDFYVEALVSLFFDTLNRPREGDLFSLTGTKIPYLNGGLFEADYDIESVNRKIKLSGGLFEELFEFLGRYNFTVDEHDEGEEEIGVDPEMLGRIFERLIEDNEKDMNGTIYTPYAVVEFMCRNALHLHLCRRLGCERDDGKGVALKRLLTEHEAEGLGPGEFAKLEEAAKDIKVLDPAVGSGAFPLGMLKELVSLREFLAEARGQATARDDLKREIIRACLYGVDIDPGAVDIARLRLFLALVVDASVPEPLPNLDFKILQGDSLAEAWEDIAIVFDPAEYRKNVAENPGELFGERELSRLNKKGQKTFMELLSEAKENILEVLDAYYDPDQAPEEKHKHRELIQALELDTIQKTLAHELVARRDELSKAEYDLKLDPKSSKEKALARARDAVAKSEGRLAAFAVLAAGSLREKPYFLWHYYFHDAFEAGGFDVIIGNPPYRANQENENDRAKNKAYPLIDARIKATFVAKSTAQKTKCYDLFARFFRLAMDFSLASRRETVVAFITNYAFIDKHTYDGFRRDVRESFGRIFVINLGGDVRGNSKLSGPVNSVFGIQAGVAISIVEKKHNADDEFELLYTATEEEATRAEKVFFIGSDVRIPIVFEDIIPDDDENWIGQSKNGYESLIPICSKDAKFKREGEMTIFEKYFVGVVTARDEWVLDQNHENLARKMKYFSTVYNAAKDFQTENRIKWSRDLIKDFLGGKKSKYSRELICDSIYRPFSVSKYYYEPIFSDVVTINHFAVYGEKLDTKTRVIGFHHGTRLPFSAVANSLIPNFSFFSADAAAWVSISRYESGTRHDNITDWSLALFRDHYKKNSIAKEDIFHYVYAVLHNPAYRAKYAVDLKRDYPRVPLYKDFAQWAAWGRRLMEIHIEFEAQTEAKGIALLRGDGTQRKNHAPDYRKDTDGHRIYTGEVRFSDGTKLTGIPPKTFDYRLGNKSAIEWVLDQYSERHWPSDADIAAGRAKALREDEKVLRDKFNAYRFADYKDYVVSLIKKLVTISLETLEIQEKMAAEEDHGVDLRRVYEKAATFAEGVQPGEEAAER